MGFRPPRTGVPSRCCEPGVLRATENLLNSLSEETLFSLARGAACAFALHGYLCPEGCQRCL